MTTTSPPVRVRVATAIDPEVARHARQFLAGAVATDLRDDRFDAWPGGSGATDPAAVHWTPPPGFIAALATTDGGQPAGYLGGGIDRNRLRLDALIDATTDDPAGVLHQLHDALKPTIDASRIANALEAVEIWGRPAESWHQHLAAEQGLDRIRALHQMRCRLPVDTTPLPTRPYEAHADLPAVQAANNRAFATHPDQGNQSSDDLLATMAEPWFEPQGLRLHERGGRLAGFCWTKIHRRGELGDLGEIYVIGVDPDYHGQGLGVPMTAAGLAWLADQGLQTGMLYVESTNQAAIRTYERLGFAVVRTDMAWLA